jgi:hypothetical protein
MSTEEQNRLARMVKCFLDAIWFVLVFSRLYGDHHDGYWLKLATRRGGLR